MRRFAPFALLGALCYVATLHPTVQWVTTHAATWPGGDFYLHHPAAFRYGALVA